MQEKLDIVTSPQEPVFRPFLTFLSCTHLRVAASVLPFAMHESPSSYSDIPGSNVIITGGAQGIGEALVRAFAGQNANVFFCDVDSDRAERVAAETGGIFSEVDLRNETQVTAWTNEVVKRCGSGNVHTLINNAGCDPRTPLAELTTEKWDDLFSVNIRPMAILCRLLEPHFRCDDSGASIINFSSVTFHIGPPEMSAYVATKAGIQGFTRSLARELGPKRIRVNAISPGWIMTERQLKDYVTDDVRNMLRERQCDPRLLQPAEIAEVALFLASNASRALTGQEFLADRGMAFS